MNEPERIWFDSSALIALLEAEPGYQVVAEILAAAQKRRDFVCLAQISLVEIAKSLAAKNGGESVRREMRLLLEMPLRPVAPTDEQCIAAGLLRAQFKLSTADAIISTQAMAMGAELVHKDPEFDAVPGLKHRRLPYKKSARKR